MKVSVSTLPKFSTQASYLRYLKLWRREYRKVSNAIHCLRVSIRPRPDYPMTMAAAVHNQRTRMLDLYKAGVDKGVMDAARLELQRLTGAMRAKASSPEYVGGAQALIVALRDPARQLMAERMAAKAEAKLQTEAWHEAWLASNVSNSRQFPETA